MFCFLLSRKTSEVAPPESWSKSCPPEDIGLSAPISGHEFDEATDDKYIQPGDTETVEQAMVSTNDDV